MRLLPSRPRIDNRSRGVLKHGVIRQAVLLSLHDTCEHELVTVSATHAKSPTAHLQGLTFPGAKEKPAGRGACCGRDGGRSRSPFSGKVCTDPLSGPVASMVTTTSTPHGQTARSRASSTAKVRPLTALSGQG